MGVLYKAKQITASSAENFWLGSVMTCVAERVMVNRQVSLPFKIASGVPQGSILGPTFFEWAPMHTTPQWIRFSALRQLQPTPLRTFPQALTACRGGVSSGGYVSSLWSLNSSTYLTTGLHGLSLRYPLEGTPSPLPPRLSSLAWLLITNWTSRAISEQLLCMRPNGWDSCDGPSRS